MSGSYVNAAGPTIDADNAAGSAAVQSATSAAAELQAQSAAFVAAHGAAVIGGHAPVGDVPPALGGK